MTKDELIAKLGALTNVSKLKEFTDGTNIPIIDQMIPKNHPNRPSRIITEFLAIGIHYTANELPSATALANAKYFGRGFKADPRAKDIWDNAYEENGVTPFRYGSTQILFDDKSGVIALPFNNVAHAVGDRPLKYNDTYKGQMPIAKWVFNNAQNIKTMNIEIANNDVIKNSTEDWDRAVSNTKKFIIWVCKELKVRINVDSSLNTTVEVRKPPVGEILLLRHYDFTGKMCPKPFIDNVQAWTDFVIEIAESVNI